MKTLIALIVATLAAAFFPAVALEAGCAGTQLAGTRAAAVDCTTAQASKVVAEFAPAVGALVSKARDGSGNIDTAALKQSAASLAVDTGACVLAEVLAQAASGKHSFAGDAPIDPAAAKAAFATVRASLWPGTQYLTSAGPL